MWSGWLVFCDYGFSVSALWCLWQLLPSYLGFSYLGCEVSLHSCSRKLQPLFLTLDKVALPDLEHGVAPFSPSAPMQPPLFGCGVAPLSCHPWPWTWGSSSRPLLCHLSLVLRHKNECIWVSYNEADEPSAYYTEWSKSEREKQISYISTYMWKLEKWYRWSYLQSRNRQM